MLMSFCHLAGMFGSEDSSLSTTGTLPSSEEWGLRKLKYATNKVKNETEPVLKKGRVIL